VILFDPPPAPADRPTRVPTPFDRAALHPLAQRAALDVMAELRSQHAAQWRLQEPGQGKMFGVLVVEAPDGNLGYLRGFSGMVDGTWDIPGWVPPTFDRQAHDAVCIAADADRHRADEERADRSRALTRQLHEAYHFANARGETRSLRSLFAPGQPPTGAGDCAGPKLLAHAYRLGLRPLALAEFWWGASAATGDRVEGVFYAACRGKCLPILTHMLGGLPADPPPLFGSAAIDAAEPRTVYEDAHLLIVHKPSGLLTVPGRSAALSDSVVTRLRARYPEATGPLVVHRLDLDTSGLLLVAKDADTARTLQRMFALREIDKQYVAWLDGEVAADHGHIRLPLRVDVDDRPRHIHDPLLGKPAHTEWQVLARSNGRTRVRFTPHTGRTHQLRVHAAHPLGLDAPITGDRLYGRRAISDDQRLHLHAERLAFVHPVTGARVEVEAPAPF
jgi:tRNA pseudouridine32 synthase / 23S rRNA pseudouridine746 synthase